MNDSDLAKALNAPVDGDVTGTVRDYLAELLITLWEEEEGFSGKRPFGNSGWQHEVYDGLVKAGVLNGTVDDDGYINDVDWREAEALMKAVIKYALGISE